MEMPNEISAKTMKITETTSKMKRISQCFVPLIGSRGLRSSFKVNIYNMQIKKEKRKKGKKTKEKKDLIKYKIQNTKY
jgi:hypothetical protein